ncbi:MAG: GTPase Era [Bacilli bacterium]|nr:GTPase Era [Bacilli bacterium]
MRCGFVSIIGRANVGKSTLLNSIIERHLAITSPVSGTTRTVIQGTYNDDNSQIIFLDTPGIHKAVNRLGRILNKQATSMFKDTDVILFVVDAYAGIGKGDNLIIEYLKSVDVPVILVLNKIDRLENEQIFESINTYKDLYPFAEIVPTSALGNDNITRLIEVIKKYLPEGVRYFSEDNITNSSKSFMISEYVREKLLRYLSKEIPHSIACVTSYFEEEENIIKMGVDIIVDRDPLKKIVIGKDGALLKQVGMEARQDIEELLGKKVFIELYVKTIENWREKQNVLKELGLVNNE